MPSANVIQLRQLLSEKFPGARWQLTQPPAPSCAWTTGLTQIDTPLAGGLPKGALTEIVCPAHSSGSATLLDALLARAAAEKRVIALVDGQDSFDVTQLDPAVLARLLWVRASSSEQALKAADFILRDANLPFVLLDLKMAAPAQLRRIPATTWYRFQRLAEETDALCLVFTPIPMVTPARVRLTVTGRFLLPSLDCTAAECVQELTLDVADLRHAAGRMAALSQSA